MKFKTNTFLITLAVVLCMTAFSFPVSANVSASEDTETEISVNDSVESKTPLTPKGNLTTVDDVHQVSDEDTIEDKQFITVQSKNGNTFYIIIDRSGDSENVYFLNAVDETDLMALMEDEQKAAVTAAATCSCTEKCEVGSVNAGCAVCSKNKDNCIAQAAATPVPDEEEQPTEKKQNTTMPFAILVLFALFGAGGAFYWFKIKNKKSSTKGDTDPNDLFEEDEDYETEDEDTEVETDAETDYEIEDEDSAISDDEREALKE